MKLKNSINNYSKDDIFQSHLLEQYKLFVETAERVSERRKNTNVFFLSLMTLLFGAYGYLKINQIENNGFFAICLTICSILISIYWIFLLENYRKLNSSKFLIIHKIEKDLPLNLFSYEWKILGKGKDSTLYMKTSNLEKLTPYFFGLLFIVLLVFELIPLIVN